MKANLSLGSLYRTGYPHETLNQFQTTSMSYSKEFKLLFHGVILKRR